MNVFVDGLKVKSQTYNLNKDGTYNVTYIGIDDKNNEIKLEYPRVAIQWYQPKRQNYFKLPIVDGINVLLDNRSNIFYTTIPD
jgi:hypothetical protein